MGEEFDIHAEMDKRPQLKHLNRYIVPHVCSVWYELGLELLDDTDISHLKTIKANNSHDCKTCCREMLETWREIKYKKATWKVLIDALRKNDQEDLVKLLLCTQGRFPVNLRYDFRCIRKLKARYLRGIQHCSMDWPEHTVSKYIKLALVEKEKFSRNDKHLNEITKLSLKGNTDKILMKKTPLDGLKDIFHYRNEPCPRLILIVGGPGIGKTTLANEICIEWAREGFLAHDFHVIILIPLRTVRQKGSLETVIEELFGKDDYLQLKKLLGEKSLIILEGLDEMSTDQQKDEFFCALMNCTIFEEATILLTSRPHACTNLKVHREIEVIGFGKKEIEEFAKESLGDGEEFKKFLQQFKEHSYLSSLCYVPLSLVMIIRIFGFLGSILPSTLTELYQKFIAMILLRPSHIDKFTYKTPAVSSSIEREVRKMLNDIPPEAVKTVSALCELAYHAFFGWCSKRESYKSWGKKGDPKIIFTVEDLKQCGFQITDDFDGFGLLKAAYVYELLDNTCTYNFVHLSIQECLCAVYIATLSEDEQLHIYKKHRHHQAYHNIFTFYCGLTQFSCEEVQKEVFIDLTEHDHCVAARRFIYESQNSEPPQSAFPFTFNNSMVFSPDDILCISYVLSHYPVKRLIMELNMQHDHLDDDQVEVLANHYKGNKELQTVNLSSNSLTSKGIEHVMKILANSPSIKKLDVSQNEIQDKGMLVISVSLSSGSTLTQLLVKNCDLSAKGIEHIKQILPMLQYFDTSHNSIGDDGLRHITESLESTDSMLTELHMERCSLSANGVTYLKTLLEKSKRLQCLNVAYNKVGNDGIRFIKGGLEQNTALTKLNICGCEIDDKGVQDVKYIVERNVNLKCLDISKNKIGDNGVKCITEGLEENDVLTEIDMSSCRLSAKAAECIKKIVLKNTIQCLLLGGNRIRTEGITQLAEGFRLNNSLTTLKLYQCFLTAKDACIIGEMIKDNYTLKCLDIRDNSSVGDEGIKAIAKDLAHTGIVELNVTGCGFTDAGAEALAAGVRNSHTIGILDVLYNPLTVNGNGPRVILEAAIANGVCWWLGMNVEFIDADTKVKKMMDTIKMRRGLRVSSDDSEDDQSSTDVSMDVL